VSKPSERLLMLADPIRISRSSMIVSDDGAEYTSDAILGWAGETGVGWRSIAPGKPQQKRLRELQRQAA
jgi:putative transposase